MGYRWQAKLLSAVFSKRLVCMEKPRRVILKAMLGLGGAVVLFVVVFLVARKPGESTLPPAGRPAVPVAEGRAGVPLAQELDLGGGVTMKLVLIPAGEFMMGSPADEKGRDYIETHHRVRITKAFYMGVTELTQEQYEAVMGKNPSFFEGAKNPVEMVSWNDAQKFCRKVSQKTGMPVRLPTEAEWEYACRGGTTMRFSFGDSDAELFRYANYADTNANIPWSDKAHNDGFANTAPVGSFKPNAWGLYDMHGNVSEWCQDGYEDCYVKSPAADPYRVLRGGSWLSRPYYLRSARRDYYLPMLAVNDNGLRVVVAAQ